MWSNIFNGSNFLLGSAFFAILLLIIIVVMVFYISKIILLCRYKSSKLGFLFITAIYIIAYWISYPGFYSVDDCNVLTPILLNAEPNWWMGPTYSFILAAGYLLIQSFGFLPLLNILFFLLLTIRIIKIIDDCDDQKPRIFSLVLLIFLALNPIHQGSILFHSRDPLFALVMMNLGLFAIEKTNKLWSWSQLGIISFLLVLFAGLRQDAVLYLAIFPFLYLLAKKIILKQALWLQLSVFVLHVIYSFGLAIFLHAPTNMKILKANILINPISHIFHVKGLVNINSNMLQDINLVLDVKLMESEYTPYDVGPLHKGAYREPKTEIEWQAFLNASYNLIWENLGIVFRHRLDVFYTLMNLQIPPFAFSDSVRFETHPVCTDMLAKLKLTNNEFDKSSLVEKQYNFLDNFYRKKYFAGILTSTLVIPLVFTLLCLFLFNYSRSFFGVAILVLMRGLVVFFIAPANYFKYMYVCLLFLSFFFPALVIEIYSKLKKKNQTE